MSNWFSDHPATSIIGHTVVVAAGVGAFCIFVFNDNRINLYKAQVETSKAQAETSKAQVDNSKTIAEQYIQKVNGLEAEIVTLKAENERYLSWLASDQKSFPALSLKISKLEKELEAAKLINQRSGGVEELPVVSSYEFSKGFSKGESFKDPKTKAVLGVSDISSNYTAYGVVTLPDGRELSLSGAKPGTGWNFKSAGKDYRLTLDSVNWINNSLKASVSEVVK